MKKTDQETYFLVSQEDIYKIDCLIGALNLAVTEILEGRPIRNESSKITYAQEDFDRQIGEYIYRG